MKRIIAVAVALLLLAAPLTALAHCRQPYRICTVRSCKKKGVHKHSGRSYRAHYSGDGHSYHRGRHH